MTTSPSPDLAAPGRRPRALQVVGRDLAAAYRAPVDWSDWYLTDEEDMGESPEQHDSIMLLQPSLERLATERGWTDVLIGGDAFFGWMPSEPNVRLSPDVYMMPAPPEGPWPGMWRTWEEGIEPPTVAIEVVSRTWAKDYRVNPEKYSALGVDELIVFDPNAPELHDVRVPLQVFRWTADGLFLAVHAGQGPAWSPALEVWVVLVETSAGVRARLAHDSGGRALVPTHEERAEAEGQRAEAEGQRAAEAERRAASLEAELARLRAASSPD